MRTVVLLVLALACSGTAHAGPCSGGSPDAVLACLTQAYAERDINAYEDLIAEDFTFGYADESATNWTREEDLAGTGNLFQDAEVRSIAIELAPAAAVEPGPRPGEWWLRGVASTLTVVIPGADEPLVVTGVSDFLVRETPGDPPRYRIAKWVEVGKPE